MRKRLKNLSILTCMAITFCGCGNKAENSGSEVDNVVITPGLNATSVNLSLQFDESDSEVASTSVVFQNNAWVAVPEFVYLKSGDPLRFTVRLYFNTTEQTAQEEHNELYCEYENIKQLSNIQNRSFDGYFHRLLGCFSDVDNDGEVDELNYEAGTEIAIDKNKMIRFEFVKAFTESNTEVFTDIDIIDWI